MKKKSANISLSSYDDIFETDESRAERQLEKIRQISIHELFPFKDHPFRVVDDEAMLEECLGNYRYVDIGKRTAVTVKFL